MKQAKIKALLEEASDVRCSWNRRNEIQCLLGHSSAGMRFFIETLYMDTIRHRPELLLSLFPVFALISGNRKKGVTFAEIDWSLVGKNKKEKKRKYPEVTDIRQGIYPLDSLG